MERKIKKIGKVLAIIVAMLVISGCSKSKLYINKKGFRNYQPKSIGIVIGHDISAKTTIWIAIGGEIQAKEYWLRSSGTRTQNQSAFQNVFSEFQKQINDMVFERINRQIIEKGYNVSLLRTKGKEWHLLEGFSDKREVYPRMGKTYELEADAKRFDAILFFEYMLKGSFSGVLLHRTKLKVINIENMQLKHANSKIFLYDTKTGKRLYFDCVQIIYPPGKTVSDVLDTLVKLEYFPD
ncbi:MAG: hypothetical protein ACFFCW_29545 [Candidatus Hodarchaeota archaeon]